MKLDISPKNLVWVDDPVSLQMAHLKRPGFVFYEMTELPSEVFLEKNMDAQEFIRRFILKAQREAEN